MYKCIPIHSRPPSWRRDCARQKDNLRLFLSVPAPPEEFVCTHRYIGSSAIKFPFNAARLILSSVSAVS